MTPAWQNLAPLSESITNNIKVEVLSQYSAANSHPSNGEWIFEYTVRITNMGTDTVQLVSRHWIITDGTNQVREVQGLGVIGEQPVLEPEHSFKYSSWCPLATPFGSMRGTYRMVRTDGETFDVEIAPFGLKARYTVH